MRNHHVDVAGEKLKFSFKGKSGVRQEVKVNDRRLARIVRQLQELPGQEIFRYVDEEGEKRNITSQDVNDYLREITGEEFTAKDFRTWAGTVLAALALNAQEAFKNKTQAERNVKDAISAVSKILGNTPTICRKCYVHPAVLELSRRRHDRRPPAKDRRSSLGKAGRHAGGGSSRDVVPPGKIGETEDMIGDGLLPPRGTVGIGMTARSLSGTRACRLQTIASAAGAWASRGADA